MVPGDHCVIVERKLSDDEFRGTRPCDVHVHRVGAGEGRPPEFLHLVRALVGRQGLELGDTFGVKRIRLCCRKAERRECIDDRILRLKRSGFFSASAERHDAEAEAEGDNENGAGGDVPGADLCKKFFHFLLLKER